MKITPDLAKNLTDRRLGHPDVQVFTTVIYEEDEGRRVIIDMIEHDRVFTICNFNNFRKIWAEKGQGIYLKVGRD